MIVAIFIFIMLVCSTGALGQVMHGNVEYDKVLKFSTNNYVTFFRPVELIILGKKRKSCPAPATLNGRRIYTRMDGDVRKRPVFPKNNFSEYLFNAIKKDLELLPDGSYKIDRSNLVVDQEGLLAYFDFDTLIVSGTTFKTFNGTFKDNSTTGVNFIQGLIDQLGLRNATPPGKEKADDPIPKEIKLKIYFSLYKALRDAPKFSPARLKNGMTVDYMLEAELYNIPDVYVVKGHKATLLKIFMGRIQSIQSKMNK